MASLENKTIRAKVNFENCTIGPDAGKWTTNGRNNQPRPHLEQSGVASDKAAWTVTTTERVTEKDADEEIPAYTVTVKTVFVHVPWRTSAAPLTAEEIAKINKLAIDAVGGQVVVNS